MDRPNRRFQFMDHCIDSGVCFKDKGGSSEVPETSAQLASSELALNEFNDYMTTIRPFENKFIADVSAPTAGREAQVAGQVGADIAQKVGPLTLDPNMGMNPGSVVDLARTTAKAKNTGNMAVKSQKAAGLQAVIDIGRGQATQAQLGMSSLAGQSVAEATNAAANDTKLNDARMSAGATAGGAAIGMIKNMSSTKK